MSLLLFNSSLALRLHRFVAAGAAVLVLLMATLAVAPEWHESLHHDHHEEVEDSCAVALFSQGVVLTLGLLVLTPPSTAWTCLTVTQPAEIFLVPPRFLRQPERGPPRGC